MERIDVIIKSIVAVIAGLFSILSEHFGVPFAVLFVLMIADFISGIMTAIYTKEKLSSSKGRRGLVKKTHTLLLIGAVALVEIYVLKTNGVFADGISGAFIMVEIVSLTENGRKMGVLPSILDRFVDAMKNKSGEIDIKKNEKEK